MTKAMTPWSPIRSRRPADRHLVGVVEAVLQRSHPDELLVVTRRLLDSRASHPRADLVRNHMRICDIV